jgi:hypothetical protein
MAGLVEPTEEKCPSCGALMDLCIDLKGAPGRPDEPPERIATAKVTRTLVCPVCGQRRDAGLLG